MVSTVDGGGIEGSARALPERSAAEVAVRRTALEKVVRRVRKSLLGVLEDEEAITGRCFDLRRGREMEGRRRRCDGIGVAPTR